MELDSYFFNADPTYYTDCIRLYITKLMKVTHIRGRSATEA